MRLFAELEYKCLIEVLVVSLTSYTMTPGSVYLRHGWAIIVHPFSYSGESARTEILMDLRVNLDYRKLIKILRFGLVYRSLARMGRTFQLPSIHNNSFIVNDNRVHFCLRRFDYPFYILHERNSNPLACCDTCVGSCNTSHTDYPRVRQRAIHLWHSLTGGLPKVELGSPCFFWTRPKRISSSAAHSVLIWPSNSIHNDNSNLLGPREMRHSIP